MASSGSGRKPSPGELQGAATPMLTIPSSARDYSDVLPPPGIIPQVSGTGSSSHFDSNEDSGNQGHDWSMQWAGSGAAIIISGGTTSVSTEDLDATAASLSSAASSLDDARLQAQKALNEVSSRPNPYGAGQRYGEPPASGLSSDELLRHYGGDASYSAPSSAAGMSSDEGLRQRVRTTAPQGPASPSSDGVVFAGEPGSLSSWAPDLWDETTTFEMRRATAVAALNSVISGPGSLGDAADALRALASDLLACSEVYSRAEGAAIPTAGGMGPVDMTGFDNMLLAWALGPDEVEGVGQVLPRGMYLYQYLLENSEQGELGLAGLQALNVLLQDPGTEAWVKNDIARLILLGTWLSRAETGRESATVQAYLAIVAMRLDPWVSARLPEHSRVGTRTVETSGLTPMQRACLYLAMLSGRSGEELFGSQTGVTVTPSSAGSPTTVPRPQDDPYGLGTPVPEHQGLWFQPSAAPGTISAAIAHGQRVQSVGNRWQRDGSQVGVVSIQRTVHADGRVSWVVYVPGTTDWTSGDQEPQDLLTNLEAVAGAPTAMESAVVTAMRQAGIRPDQEVALYGHSQGGITVSNIASDPAIQERYRITTVLTAGSPTAGADLPDGVHALHLENGADAVPGLDGAATPIGENRQVAFIDTHEQGNEHYPHGSDVYAQAARGMEESYPEIAPWSRSFASATGAGEAGAQTTEQVFVIHRDISGRTPHPGQGTASRPEPTAPADRSRQG